MREKDGGLPAVRALGFELKDRGLVQVSMNLIDYKITGLEQAFDAVSALAAKHGVPVSASEIVGLVPADALPPDPIERLRLEGFDLKRQVLENRLAG